MTINSEESPAQPPQPESAATDASVDPRRIESAIVGPDDRDYARYGRPDAQVVEGLVVGSRGGPVRWSQPGASVSPS